MTLNISYEIQKFEQENNINLPEDYVQFLINFSQSSDINKNSEWKYSFNGLKHDLEKQCLETFSTQYKLQTQESTVTNFISFSQNEKLEEENKQFRLINKKISHDFLSNLYNGCFNNNDADYLLQLQVDNNMKNINISSKEVSLIAKNLKFIPIAYRDIENDNFTTAELIIMNIDSNSPNYGAIYNWAYLGSYWHPSFETDDWNDMQRLWNLGYSSKEIDEINMREFEDPKNEYFKEGSKDDFALNYVSSSFQDFLKILTPQTDNAIAA